MRTLEVLNDITHLSMEGSMPEISGADGRGELVRKYQCRFGARYLPTGISPVLQWDYKAELTLEIPRSTMTWGIVPSSKRKKGATKDKSIVKSKNRGVVSAPLKKPRVADISSNGSSAVGMTTPVPPRSHRVRDHIAFPWCARVLPTAHLSTVQMAAVPEYGMGLQWDSVNWSCTYDSLITMLLYCRASFANLW